MSAEHAPESEAVEAAKRIVLAADYVTATATGAEYEKCHAVTMLKEALNAECGFIEVARALLSLSSRVETAREEMKEECAKVAEADHTPAYGPHKDAMEHLADTQRRNIAERIRSLSVK